VIGVVVASFIATQCSGGACPNPCTQCTFQPVQGTDPTTSEYEDLFKQIAQRQGASDLPSIGNLENGANRNPTPANFACTLMPAIGAVESGIEEFCGGNGLTVISFDCGFGVMQVTSGAANYPGIESRADINIAAGADILSTKWNDDADFGGHFGDSDPGIIESWYFAVWAYNGFVYSNNPNNPNLPANRPPFNGPASLSRGSYPYQELVWGFVQFPLNAMWQSIPISYPTDIPNQSGLFSVSLPLPANAHRDDCVEQCPPSGCPPQDQRTLFVDDEDTTFNVTGPVTDEATGGFRDHFYSASPAPAGSPTVVAHFAGLAPSSGTFDFAGFIPIGAADCTDTHVVVHARGAPKTFSLDEDVTGGDFRSLGSVVLEQGQVVTVEVDNGTSDNVHAVGIDAFRFTWTGDGAVAIGDSCTDDVDCAGDAICVSGVCAAGCETAGCPPSSACDPGTGLCSGGAAGEGEGEAHAGEGEGERVVVTPPRAACTCSSSSSSSSPAFGFAAIALALAVLRARLRR
jgi:hypothetical protein